MTRGEAPDIHVNSYNYMNRTMKDDAIIILDDLEFAWKKEEIRKAIKLWEYGVSLNGMVKRLKRNKDEVFLLLLHLVRTAEIKPRENYIWGKIE